MSSKDRYRERPRDRERERSRERSKHSSRDERDSRHDSRRHEHKQKDRDRDRERERDRENERERRHRSRSREKSRDRDRERRKSRERDGRHQESSPAVDDSSRKRRRVEDDKQQPPQQQQQQRQEQHTGLTEDEKEAAHKKQRQDEQDALDAEMEERRKRVEEWRKKRAAEAAAAELERRQQEEAAAAAAAAEAAGKGWSLEDDEDDEVHEQQGEDEVDPLDAFMGAMTAAAPQQQQQQQRLKPPIPAAAVDGLADVQMTDADIHTASASAAADGDDVDPLDAFMAAQVMPNAAAAAEVAAAADDDDDVDPLDAFMAAQVIPEVAKVRWSETVAEPTADAAAAGGSAAAAGESSRPGSRPGTPSSSKRAASSKPKSSRVRRYYGSSSSEEFTDSDEEVSAEEAEEDDATWAKNVTAGKLSKGDKLMAVDHATIEYPHFRRNFYIEVPEIKRMSDAEVAALRKELDGIKVRGKNPPRPIRAWTQSGISSKVLEMLRKQGFDRPLAIQAQALPIIMSGRDCIGIAKTGSGKTLAFVLPMLRHIKDQPPLANGDGPIALIMAPTRELVQQISKEVKRLGRAVALSSVAVFGGSGVANQISELKRGTEVVVATPGRLIDLLVSGGGKITNLRRVTYLVMDEADRMFDMGFEPQIMRIVGNIRPDRQTVMFSATFPRSVETLARQVLQDPVEIQVGGRSVVNSDIAQFVEIRPESERFLRLLEVLGEWYEAGKIIIFVHTQDKCDNLFRDLLKAGYPCLSLHGGKEQSDRECTIADFKGAVCNILVATSVAARGLDVRDLVLVVNYDVPNHHEDYVHRVGRTGRAGNKGTAITFIGPDEERYAPDLVKALKESSAPVPQDLQALAESFQAKRKAGLVQGHGSGYGGSGYKFDKSEDAKIKAARKSKAKEFGIVDDEEDGEGKAAGEDSDDDIRPANQPSAAATAAAAAGAAAATAAAAAATAAAPNGITVSIVPGAQPVSGTAAAMLAAAAAAGAAPAGAAAGAAAAAGSKFMPSLPGQQFPGQAIPQTPATLLEAAKAAAEKTAQQLMGGAAGGAAAAAPAGGAAALAAAQAAAMRAAALAAAFSQGGGTPAAAAQAAAAAAQQQQRNTGFEAEMEINDFPQNARWKVTHKGFQAEITELTGAAVTTKGIYVKSGEPPEGERKLFLLIEAPTEGQVRRAKQEIRRVIEEHVEKAMRRDTGAGGRYTIM